MISIRLGGYSVGYSLTRHHGTGYVDIVVLGQGGRYLR